MSNFGVFPALLLSISICECSYDISDKTVFPKLPNAAPRSANTICGKQSRLYLDHLDNMTLWAHTMMDASAKSYEGVLVAANFHFGNFDECLSVAGPFRTQYCLVTLDASIPDQHKPVDPYSLDFSPFDHVFKRLHKSFDMSQESRNTIKVGWCIPASCTAKDLQIAANEYIAQNRHPFHDLNVTYSVSVEEVLCQRENETLPFDGLDISFCITALTLILLLLIGTMYEMQGKAIDTKTLEPSTIGKLVSCFSVRQSCKDLCLPEGSNRALKPLYGIRTFAIMMIVIDHRFGTFMSGAIDNFDFIEKEYRSVASWYLFHGDLFVDTFFVLSGILVTYGLLTQCNRNDVHPVLIIVARYVRLTPVYAFVVYFWATMMRHIGDGPLWRIVGHKEAADCRKYWWANVLYVNNYVGVTEMCMAHSWYLPCDTHYFIAAILLVKLIYKHRRIGIVLLSVVYLLSVAVPFVITAVYMRPGLINFYPEFTRNPKTNYDFNLTYIKSHTRASPYILGMFAGYWLFKICSILLAIVSICCLFLGLSSGAIFYNPYHKYDMIEASFYASLHRSLWAFGTVGLIVAASYGHAPILYNILSWQTSVVLGKLVYGVYLVHILFQLRSVGVSRSLSHMNYFNIFSSAISDIVLAFAFSFLLYISIENPVRKLMKILLFSERKEKNGMKEPRSSPSSQRTLTTSHL